MCFTNFCKYEIKSGRKKGKCNFSIKNSSFEQFMETWVVNKKHPSDGWCELDDTAKVFIMRYYNKNNIMVGRILEENESIVKYKKFNKWEDQY